MRKPELSGAKLVSKCFREKLTRQQVYMPVDDNGEIDEETIEKFVINTSYWDYLAIKVKQISQFS